MTADAANLAGAAPEPAGMAGAPVLRVEGLKAYYRTRHFGVEREVKAVDGVSFEVRDNEIYGLAGESSSGKSTLLKAIAAAMGAVSCFERCDIRDVAALRRAIQNARERLGPITILINNAARDDRHVSEEVTPEYWDERMAVNLKHQFFAAQAVLPDMKAAHWGSIINFGSSSWMVGQGGMPQRPSRKKAKRPA